MLTFGSARKLYPKGTSKSWSVRKWNVDWKGGPPKTNFNGNGTSPLGLILRDVDADAAAAYDDDDDDDDYANAAAATNDDDIHFEVLVVAEA